MQKKCYECDKHFSQAFNFCPDCGEILKLSDKKPPGAKPKEISIINVDTTRKDGDKKVKIGVLNSVSGILEPIKQTEGGGNRFCFLYDTDTFEMILKKVVLIYFPGITFFKFVHSKKINFTNHFFFKHLRQLQSKFGQSERLHG